MEAYYLDAGIFLGPMLKNLPAEKLQTCEEWLLRLGRGEIVGVTSWLTWDEVVWIAGKPRLGSAFNPEQAARASTALLSQSNLRLMEVDRAVIERACLLLTEGLRPRDCIHASTALLHTQGRIVSTDEDFDLMPSALGLTVHSIRSVGH